MSVFHALSAGKIGQPPIDGPGGVIRSAVSHGRCRQDRRCRLVGGGRGTAHGQRRGDEQRGRRQRSPAVIELRAARASGGQPPIWLIERFGTDEVDLVDLMSGPLGADGALDLHGQVIVRSRRRA